MNARRLDATKSDVLVKYQPQIRLMTPYDLVDDTSFAIELTAVVIYYAEE